MRVNEAMMKLGFMGAWQVLCCFMVLFMVEPSIIWSKYSIIFVGYIPKHHCKYPDNSSMQQWIPKDKDGNFESCSMFVNSSVNNATVDCTDGWEYDDKESGVSIVNEWDLVCEKAYYAGFSNIIFSLGEMGAFFLVGLSDIYGRKPIMLLFLFLCSISGIINSFAGSFTAFVLGKFFIGLLIAAGGVYSVYLAEITSEKNREFIVTCSFAHWGIIGCLMVFIAYIAHNWRYFRFVTNAFGLLMLPFLIWLLPESVYWLHANNRIEEAEDVLMQAGKLNKVTFTKPILTPPNINENSDEDKKYFEEKTVFKKIKLKFEKIFKKGSGSKEKLETEYSIKELYRNPYLLRHMSLAIYLIFKITNTTGLTIISPAMSSRMYLSTFFTFIVEIPCGFIGWILSKKYRLKRMMIFFMFMTSFFTFICGGFLMLADERITNYTTVIFCTLAKFTGNIVWACSYTYESTLFPTNLRNQALGICHFGARFGLMIASLGPFMLTILPRGTYIIFGVCALISTLILFILPDTQGFMLPETIEDVEAFYKKDEMSQDTEVGPVEQQVSADE